MMGDDKIKFLKELEELIHKYRGLGITNILGLLEFARNTTLLGITLKTTKEIDNLLQSLSNKNGVRK